MRHSYSPRQITSDNVTFLNPWQIRAEGAFTDLALRGNGSDIHCF